MWPVEKQSVSSSWLQWISLQLDATLWWFNLALAQQFQLLCLPPSVQCSHSAHANSKEWLVNLSWTAVITAFTTASQRSALFITWFFTPCYKPIIMYYYSILLHPYYILIISLLHDYYVIISDGKSCNNDSIIAYYATSVFPLSHYSYLLLYHNYKGDYCYSLLHLSVSQSCKYSQQHLKGRHFVN